MKKKYILLFFICHVIFSYSQSDGTLDTTFNFDGKVITDFGYEYEIGTSVTIQTDGKIIVAGMAGSYPNYDFVLIRYNTDGGLDNTFGSNGKILTDFSPKDGGNSVILQSDEKIIVGGYSWNGSNYDFALARYNTDGTLDNTFGNNGKVFTDFGWDDTGGSIAIQSDGKIILAGTSYNYFALARYNTDGTLDNTFGSNGAVFTNFDGTAYSVAIQSDGKIIVAGTSSGDVNTNFALARYNINGTLDNTFDFDGKVITNFDSCGGGYDSGDFGYSIIIQSDEKIIVAGSSYCNDGSYYNFALARYNIDGSLDLTFDSDSKVITDFGGDDQGHSVALQSDGKIVVAGWSYSLSEENENFALARYNQNGSLDGTFGSNGKVITDFGENDRGQSVVIQSDGKIVVAGWTYSSDLFNDFVLARYNCDSCGYFLIEDIYSEQLNIIIYPNPTKKYITIENVSSSNLNNEMISIYNLQAQLLLQKKLQKTKTEINLGSLAKGIYIAKISADDTTFVTKILKE